MTNLPHGTVTCLLSKLFGSIERAHRIFVERRSLLRAARNRGHHGQRIAHFSDRDAGVAASTQDQRSCDPFFIFSVSES